MDEENKKIDIGSFFGRLDSIEAVANDAILKSESNLGTINELSSIITNISTALESLKTEVQEINNYIVIQKDVEEDRRFEEEDARQKQEMSDRTSSLQGKGTGVAAGAAAGASTEGNEFGKDPVKKGGLFQGIRQLGNLFNLSGSLIASGIGAAGSGLGNVLQTINPFNKLGGISKNLSKDVSGADAGGTGVGGILEKINPFSRKKDEKEKVKEEIKSEIKQELNLKGGEKKNIVTGEKQNKLMNFVKQGGVAGFLSRKIFGKKENKAQEVGATNPENKGESYSESSNYKGRIDPETFEFIPDEGSLPPGVPLEKAQQDVYKSKIKMLEFDFRSDIREGLTREEAIKSYGPQSNLYRFKENYNKTLKYGGYELDVGKHYDSIKNSMSGKRKGKGQDSSLKGEKRGIKGVVGGVADALTGGFFNFDKRGNTKGQDFIQGTADTLTGGFFDFDKRGNTKGQDFIQGTADTLTGGIFDFDKKGSNKLQRFQQGAADAVTGGFFDFDKKGNNKIQDFQQGTADTLTGGIFDFDKKGSTKLQRFGQGFMDAMTGNLTDFDRKGGKTVGPTRAITGMLDFATANMFDLDKRGGLDLFGFEKKRRKKEINGELQNFDEDREDIKDPFRDTVLQTLDGRELKRGDKGFESELKKIGNVLQKSGAIKTKQSETQPVEKKARLDTRFDMESGKAYVDGQEVDPTAYSEFKKLPYVEQLKQRLDFFNETSSMGGESSNLSQKIDFLSDEVNKLVPTDNEIMQTNNLQPVQSPNLGNKGVLAQQDLANVAEVEIKSTTSDIAFVNLQRLQSSKFNNITHVNESELPSSIRKLLKIS